MTTERAGPAPEIGDAAADVLRAAYYYALADGHAVVDTSLVLMAAARNDSEVARPVLGPAVAEARETLAARAERTGDPDAPVVPVPCPAAGALREARWWVLRDVTGPDRARFGLPDDGGGGPVWGQRVCAALERAGRAAQESGGTRVGVAHLLLGLLDEQDGAIGSLALSLGFDVGAVARRVRAAAPGADVAPATPLLNLIEGLGAVEERIPWPVRWIPRVMARVTTRNGRLGGPVLAGLELEVMRQAVVTGHRSVPTSAVLLAVMSLDEQLAAAGKRLRAPYLQHNQGGRVLADAGAGLRRAQQVAEAIAEEGRVLPAEEASERFWTTGKLGDPTWGQAAAQAMDRAGTIAKELGHLDIGTSHLLAAVVQDESSAAQRVLTELGFDLRQVRERVNAHLVDA